MDISSNTFGSGETTLGKNQEVLALVEQVEKPQNILNDDAEEVQAIIIELPSQNKGQDEKILMTMPTELFEKCGYVVINYTQESEGVEAREVEERSDKIMSVRLLSPGEIALLNGSYEIYKWVHNLESKEMSSGELCHEAEGNEHISDINGSLRSSNGLLAKTSRGFRNEKQLTQDKNIVKLEEGWNNNDNEEEVPNFIIDSSSQYPRHLGGILITTSPELLQTNEYAVNHFTLGSKVIEARQDEEGTDKSVSILPLSPAAPTVLNAQFEMIGWVTKQEVTDSSLGAQSNEAAGTHKTPDSNGSKSSTNASVAEQLRAIRNQDGLYVCVYCSKVFRHKSSCHIHVKTHIEDAPTCSVCKKILSNPQRLKTHMRIHTGEKPHNCEACGKGFADKSNLKVHMRVHTAERPYRCELCNKGFMSSSGFVRHRRLHTGERPFPCGSCDELFCIKSQLQNHLKKVHLTRTCHRCQYCSEFFASLKNLKSHLQNFH